MIEAKVIKVKNISDRDEKEMWIQTGDTFYGKITKWPEIGESFYLFENGNSIDSRYDVSLRTTPVTEIINDREFKTLNSIYKIITKSDERDERIKTILE
jgi:hypothetical protein